MRSHVGMRGFAVCVVLAAATAHADNPYDPAALKAQVAALADPSLDGRAPGTDGDKAARAAITARLEALGLHPAEQAFEFDGHATANILATLPGSDPDAGIIVVGAHRPPSEMEHDLEGRFARLETLAPVILRRAGRPAIELTIMRGIDFEPEGRK